MVKKPNNKTPCALPERIPMQATMFLHGANGAVTHIYVNKQYGVHMAAHRVSRKHQFTQMWLSTYLPNKKFTSYRALRAAIKGI